MYKPKRIIIVGGNAAGPSAAAKAKRVNPEAEVIMIEASGFISTGTCEIPYLFSGEIENYSNLVFFDAESFNVKKGVKVYTNTRVTKINRKEKSLTAISKESGEELSFDYDKLILATGANAKELEDLPFALENVFPLKSISDYVSIENYIKNNTVKKILVVGAGYIGLELSDALSSQKYNVTLLEKKSLPIPTFDYEIQNIAFELIKNSSVKFLNSDGNTRFIIKQNKFSQLINNGYYLDYDLAIVCAGVIPNTQLAKNAGLKIGRLGGIEVDNRMKTSDPNIFAVGDVIEVKDFISRSSIHLPLATIAHITGHIAGENAAGGNTIFYDVISNSSFKSFGKFFAKVGLSEFESKDKFKNVSSAHAVLHNKVKVMPNSSKVFGKIIYDNYSKQILGASFVGDEEVSGYVDLISMMIRNRIPADKLAENNYNYTPPLSPFINLLSVLGRKIKGN